MLTTRDGKRVTVNPYRVHEDEEQVELDFRSHDSLEVYMLWDPKTNAVSVKVIDYKDGNERFTLSCTDGKDAREKFLHPFAFA